MDINVLETFLQREIFPDLENGRSTDKAHTLLVATKLKEIIKNSPNIKVDSNILLIAAYAHDWGYTNLFDRNSSLRLAAIGAQKDAHMLIGAKKLTELLKNKFFAFLKPVQKERAIYLVSFHDKLEELKDLDELILMEADSLGGMDIEIMGIFKFKESEERFMRKSRDLRFSKFITDYGKKEFERLFKKRQKYFEEHGNA